METAKSKSAIRNVESLITNKVDVLVIVPHNGEVMAKGVEMAQKAGIPVIAYDRMIQNCNLDLYMSFDNVKVGLGSFCIARKSPAWIILSQLL